jgi:KUP system potassium uptake protein
MMNGNRDRAGLGNGRDTAGAVAVKPSKRSFNEAAHKLPYRRSVRDLGAVHDDDGTAAPRSAGEHAAADGDVIAHAGRAVLALGALGVVYGDIGTSPLYTEQITFGFKATQHITTAGVYGVVSLMFWSLAVIVSTKYAGFIMRAHNRGDGGIMALAALVQRHKVAHAAALVTLGIFGAALFFGDGMITPAISVLSAVSGLEVATPGVAHLVVPISVVILVALFAVQRQGTHTVGWMFGPIMLVWFGTIALLGLPEIVKHPGVFQALSPSYGVSFFADHGFQAFLVLGGVVLTVTGAEALYADRGHFGPGPIRLGWFALVWPCLMANYLGQAGWILGHPKASLDTSTFNPFFSIVPGWGQLPMVILATVATIIASQAVISGSYSVARQAMQLGYLPRLRVIHTSETEGQIYVPVINWVLAVGVVTLVLVFRNSNGLANAYGVAVTGTFILNTTLFLAVARALWKTPKWRLALLGALFLTVEVTFFLSNLAKIFHGAWLPLVAGIIVSVVMMTWRRGQLIVTANRHEKEGDLGQFLDKLGSARPPIRRVPGTAIFLNPGRETTPLAMRSLVEHTHALHEHVVIVSVVPASVPYVLRDRRFEIKRMGRGLCQLVHLTVRSGYQERTSVPEALALARKLGYLPRNFDLENASYFLSRITIAQTEAPGMDPWRKKVFLTMARNAASPIEHFGLPVDRTVAMGSQINL